MGYGLDNMLLEHRTRSYIRVNRANRGQSREIDVLSTH